jgi:predicted nuclease of restriction endonuclease-like (RecB) superfamily
MLVLYWYIGKEILARQQQQGWGSKVLTRPSQDLKREFPEMKGFSLSNLKYMRAFAEAWTEQQISQRALANLPWRQNVALLEKLKKPDERLWYAEKAVEHGWSRTILVTQIETDLYQQEGGAISDCDERTLPR